MHGDVKIRFVSGIGHDGQRNFSISNNRNKRQELKFYLHGTGPDQHMETFTKVKDHLYLKSQNEIVNGSYIEESIRKGDILDLSK